MENSVVEIQKNISREIEDLKNVDRQEESAEKIVNFCNRIEETLMRINELNKKIK